MPENTTLKKIQKDLQQALKQIDCYKVKYNLSPKPTLRIIHHFACSGGTLISKCLAAQPNVFLLSELHPTTQLGINMNKAAYTPRDITTQAIYGRVPSVDDLAEKLFVNGIIETEKHIRERGGYLVIRAHTHSDYCTDAPIPEVDTISRLLEPHFELKHLVTVRNPIESFMSLRDNGWIHFEPASFDEYCRRLLKFIKPFDSNQIMKYESFVESSDTTIKCFAEKLDIPLDIRGLSYFDIFKVSGDSGRSGTTIEARPSKQISGSLNAEAQSSVSYKNLIRELGYESICG